MADDGTSRATRALAVRNARELSGSRSKGRSVRSGATKQWQPPEGLAPEDVLAVIDAAATERDRLLLRVLWATGARVSEALSLRIVDVRRDSLVRVRSASSMARRKSGCARRNTTEVPARRATAVLVIGRPSRCSAASAAKAA